MVPPCKNGRSVPARTPNEYAIQLRLRESYMQRRPYSIYHPTEPAVSCNGWLSRTPWLTSHGHPRHGGEAGKNAPEGKEMHPMEGICRTVPKRTERPVEEYPEGEDD